MAFYATAAIVTCALVPLALLTPLSPDELTLSIFSASATAIPFLAFVIGFRRAGLPNRHALALLTVLGASVALWTAEVAPRIEFLAESMSNGRSSTGIADVKPQLPWGAKTTGALLEWRRFALRDPLPMALPEVGSPLTIHADFVTRPLLVPWILLWITVQNGMAGVWAGRWSRYRGRDEVLTRGDPWSMVAVAAYMAAFFALFAYVQSPFRILEGLSPWMASLLTVSGAWAVQRTWAAVARNAASEASSGLLVGEWAAEAQDAIPGTRVSRGAELVGADGAVWVGASRLPPEEVYQLQEWVHLLRFASPSPEGPGSPPSEPRPAATKRRLRLLRSP